MSLSDIPLPRQNRFSKTAQEQQGALERLYGQVSQLFPGQTPPLRGPLAQKHTPESLERAVEAGLCTAWKMLESAVSAHRAWAGELEKVARELEIEAEYPGDAFAIRATAGKVRSVAAMISVSSAAPASLSYAPAVPGVLTTRDFHALLASRVGRVDRWSVTVIGLSALEQVHRVYGALVEDQARQCLAARITHRVRPVDLTGWLGPREIGIVWSCGQPEALSRSRQAADVTAEPILVHVGEDTVRFRVELEVGVAEHRPGERLHDLLERAREGELVAVPR